MQNFPNDLHQQMHDDRNDFLCVMLGIAAGAMPSPVLYFHTA